MTYVAVDAREHELDALILSRVEFRSGRLANLGPVNVRLRSNVPDFGGYHYFTKFREPSVAAGDYQVDCIDTSYIDDVSIEDFLHWADTTYRSWCFQGGHYVTSHFGAPAVLITSGRRMIIVGRGLQRIIWPYVVKYILTAYSATSSWLHLKGAAFASADGSGATLLFGKRAGGKTVFLTQACRHGARFIANTHIMVRDNEVWGVPTAMRVRPDHYFNTAISDGRATPHFERGEYVVDPAALFGVQGMASHGNISSLCIVDYSPSRVCGMSAMEPEPFCDFLEQFSFPISVYGLKDDILSYLEEDMVQYLTAYQGMKERMWNLVTSAPLFYANVDMLDRATSIEVLQSLRQGPGR